MTEITLLDLQASVQDRSGFKTLEDFARLCRAFLDFVANSNPTKIISPTHTNYLFYQYSDAYGYRITRPLNSDLYFEGNKALDDSFERFGALLNGLRKYQEKAIEQESVRLCLDAGEINKVIYTIQQSIGCIGDSFDNPNQSRKRIGQLFERLVKLIIQEVGLECEPRTITIPIVRHSRVPLSGLHSCAESTRRRLLCGSQTGDAHQ